MRIPLEKTTQKYPQIIEPQAALAPLSFLNAAVRESDRRRSWAAYRKVVEADPNTTIAPPWPPFVAPPTPSPSPEFSVSPLWASPPSPRGTGHHAYDRKESPLPLASLNDGYAWWKYVLASSTPSSPVRVVDAPGHVSRSDSEYGAFRPFSGTAGTSPSSSSFSYSSSSASGGCTGSLAPSIPAESARAERLGPTAADTAAAAAAARPDADLAACIAQMLLECRADADAEEYRALEQIWDEFEEEEEEGDSLADGHVYDCGLEKEIKERAAIAQHLNWMLRGVVPMG